MADAHARALEMLGEMEARTSAQEGFTILLGVRPTDLTTIHADAPRAYAALRAVLEMHRPEQRDWTYCVSCDGLWPCPTVERIVKALEGEDVGE